MVAKGVEDISMLYYLNSSGIKNAPWGPQFSLPIVWIILKSIEERNLLGYRDAR